MFKTGPFNFGRMGLFSTLLVQYLQTCALICERELPQAIFSNRIPRGWHPNSPRHSCNGCHRGSALGVCLGGGDDQEPVGHVHGDDFRGGNGDFNRQDLVLCGELHSVAGGAGGGDAGDDDEVVVLEEGFVVAFAGVLQGLGTGFLQKIIQSCPVCQVDKGQGTRDQAEAGVAGHQIFQGGLGDIVGPDDLGLGGGGGGGHFRLRFGRHGGQQIAGVNGGLHRLPGHLRLRGGWGFGVLRCGVPGRRVLRRGVRLSGGPGGLAAGEGQHQGRCQAEGGKAGQCFGDVLLFHRIPSHFWCWTGAAEPAFVNPDGFFRPGLRAGSKISPLSYAE